MTAENLAMCFAPTLLCGPDQLEDAKIAGIIRRVLATAAELWTTGLREASGIDEAAFARDLEAPTRREEYEDPLAPGSMWEEPEAPPKSPGFTQEQQAGIILQNNDHAETRVHHQDPTRVPPPLPSRQQFPTPAMEGEKLTESRRQTNAPSLPPRHGTGPLTSAGPVEDIAVRRKQVPAVDTGVGLPPRYSTVVSDPNEVSESPSTYTVPANGFAPRHPGDWSFEMSEGGSPTAPLRHDSQVKRKPISGTPTTPQEPESK